MKKKPTPPSRFTRWLTVSGFGVMCALGAFSIGMKTAGNFLPFDRGQAAVSEQRVTDSGKGDVDGDGMVTLRDATLLLEFLNQEKQGTQTELVRADMNDDTLVTMADLRILLDTLGSF